jgi:hypothetical protein
MENKSKIYYDCNQTSRRNDCLSEGPLLDLSRKRSFVLISVPPEAYFDSSLKKKVKLSLCLTNYALHHEDVRGGSGCIDPHFRDLGTSWS